MNKPKCLSFLFSLLFLVLLSPFLQAQQADSTEQQPKRMAFYGTFGTLILSYTTNINLERLVWQNPDYAFGSIWVKAGVGLWTHIFNYSNGGTSASLEMMAMTGTGKHHFEFCGGASYFYDRIRYNDYVSDRDNYNSDNPDADPEDYPLKPKSEFRSILPSGSIGYRLQKPDDDFVFRCGVGFPDAIYVSLGLCF